MTNWRYRGSQGWYDIEIGGNRVGLVVAGFDSWTAALWHDNRWKWTSPTRRQAAEQLIAHHTINGRT